MPKHTECKILRKMEQIKERMAAFSIYEADYNGSHIASLHCEKSDSQLEKRLLKEKREVVSTFLKEESAEEYIKETVLDDGDISNLRELADWMYDPLDFEDMEFRKIFNHVVGRACVINKLLGRCKIKNCYEVIVVIRKVWKGNEMDFVIVTSYPGV